ncbi:MAG: hypothetical protein LC802_22885 [Acidobacteria bacterium]|nr:hypothetical protein [Acidobacteriota bacterium]
MRDLTKSMMSYTWAMSLFGVQQVVNIFRPQQQGQENPATSAFENVTQAAQEEFGDVMRATFRAGDNLQRGVLDLTFGMFGMGRGNQTGGGNWTCRDDASGMGSNIGQQSAEAFRQGMRAMGQTANAVGQTVQGAASAASSAAQQGAGWVAAAAPGAGGGGGNARTSAQSESARQTNPNTGGASCSSGQQSAGWGPMPKRDSNSRGNKS